ncbi:MAG: DUF1735 domain-containing protein [Bacteroidales bacterium]|nr:DUF1735 domain-containing protein [Bacteroidales bacterium]
MKKSVISALAGLAMFAISCNPTPEPTPGPTPSDKTGTYGIYAYDKTEYLDFAYGGVKTISFCAQLTEGKVIPTALTVKFKADESKVADFNKGREAGTEAIMLPSTCYSFDPSDATATIMKSNKKSMTMEVTITGNLEKGKYYVLPVVIDSIEGSDEAGIDGTPMYIVFYISNVDKGKGTKDEPYLIYSAGDLENVADNCKTVSSPSADPTYFKLMNDIDMTGETWVPINWDNGYNKKIDFNGNNRTISNLSCVNHRYASLFGVLYGKVYDLTVKDAYIEHSSYAIGIIAGYAGTGDSDISREAYCTNVHVSGTVKNTGDNKNGIGGFFGRVYAGGIEKCSADVTIESVRGFVGGIYGYETNDVIFYVRNCITKGSITASEKFLGGIVGGFTKDNLSVENCISTMSIKGPWGLGGIVAEANHDKQDVQTPHNTVKNCIAWNPRIEATNYKNEHNWSSGAIVGFSSYTNTLTNCYRRPDMEYICGSATLYDQENSSASTPLTVQGTACDWTSEGCHNAPYHGKAAAKGKTASDVARDLGWDETIWDLSGDIPALK